MAQRRPPAAGILLVPVAVALVLTLFAWPSARLEPRDLPIGVAGPPAAVRAIEQKLNAREGAFEVHHYATAEDARRAIDDRDVYGAFVATRAGITVLTASAGSAAVAQLLERAARESGATVRDVVPAPRASTALGASVLPLVLAGILTGAAAAHLGTGSRDRLALVLIGSVLGGLVATLIVQAWLDVVGGGWLANAAVLSLTVLAIAAFTAGLFVLFGSGGAIAGALIMVLIGNPFSGVASAPELLPKPAGAIGQLMPPGAGGNLLRSTGFFDGAGAGGHVTVLTVWAVAGMAALLASRRVGRTAQPRLASAYVRGASR